MLPPTQQVLYPATFRLQHYLDTRAAYWIHSLISSFSKLKRFKLQALFAPFQRRKRRHPRKPLCWTFTMGRDYCWLQEWSRSDFRVLIVCSHSQAILTSLSFKRLKSLLYSYFALVLLRVSLSFSSAVLTKTSSRRWKQLGYSKADEPYYVVIVKTSAAVNNICLKILFDALPAFWRLLRDESKISFHHLHVPSMQRRICFSCSATKPRVVAHHVYFIPSCLLQCILVGSVSHPSCAYGCSAVRPRTALCTQTHSLPLCWSSFS